MPSFSNKGQSARLPPPVVPAYTVPSDDHLKGVAANVIQVLQRCDPRKSGAPFDPQATLVAVELMPPAHAYEVFCSLEGGTIPRVPNDFSSDIGRRLKDAMIKLLREQSGSSSSR